MKTFSTLASAAALALAITLSGCATKIKLEVDRPPNFYVADIKKIAVMGFSGSPNSAGYAAEKKIKGLNRYAVTNSTAEADAVLRGVVSWSHLQTKQKVEMYKDKKGKPVYRDEWTTNVYVAISYTLERVSDGSVIGSRQMHDSKQEKTGWQRNPRPLADDVVEGMLNALAYDLAPYTVIEKRAFAKETSEATVVKDEMKSALEMVKAKKYDAALEAYIKSYERHRNFAAAENAAILYEAFGNIQAAANLMESALAETKNPRAQTLLDKLNKIIKDKEIIEKEYNSNDNPPPSQEPSPPPPPQLQPQQPPPQLQPQELPPPPPPQEPPPSPRQASVPADRFGAQARLSLNSFSSGEGKDDFDMGYSFGGGIVRIFPYNEFLALGVETNVYYRKLFSYTQGREDIDITEFAISVPAAIQFSPAASLPLYLSAGLQIDIPFSSEWDIDGYTEEVEDRAAFDIGIVLGAGYNITPSLAIDFKTIIGMGSLTSESRDKSSLNQYNFGLINFF